jgi:hypothetical protein
MNQTNLEKMESIIDSEFPDIKEFILHKSNDFIEVEIPYNTGANWQRLNNTCSKLISGYCTHPIKNRTITFNEKHSYFKIIFDLV